MLENFQLFAVDRDGKNAKELTPFEKVKILLIDDLEDNDDELIIGMNKNNPMLFEPYRINIHTGEYTRLADNDNPQEPITAWMTDHDGKLRIAIKTIAGVEVTDSMSLAKVALEEAKVALVPGGAFGEDRCVRLSFATSMEQIDKGLDRLAKLLS